MSDRLMLVGYFESNHVGGHVVKAAEQLGLETTLAHVLEANSSHRIVRSIYQRVRRNRPFRLEEFSRHVVSLVRRDRPRWLIGLGITPITGAALQEISELGVQTINFPTDDPWNGNRQAAWLFESLPRYDAIFTPRPANVAAFRDLGCPRVELMHFGYDPEAHRRATAAETSTETRAADVVFIGGADRDRYPYIEALMDTKLKVAVYGVYWNRNLLTRTIDGGLLSLKEMRTVLAKAKMSICVVRRANRDEHVMRTYEEPMMGKCMALEDTIHHRELFSDPVMDHAFFKTPDELAECAVKLCANAELRDQIGESEYRAVAEGGHTYLDRLRTMLDLEPA